MRAFLAVNLGKPMKANIAGFQERLKSRTRGIRWVNPDLLHFTLKFLGEIGTEDPQIFEKPLADLARETRAFHFTLGRLGAFPNRRNPRVIWLGMQSGAEQLSLLAEKVENVLGSSGYSKFSFFVPHLTIGRRKRNADVFFPAEIFQENPGCHPAGYVDRFFLMQSTLRPGGPVYTPLKEFLLDVF
ncbi:MAG TPA: RNA 2',3'-cyclic phosphodiesterase [Firmicutes bacterium]|jgi:2'-5' RNA ligase|nr:RNA 2',3'-cyclic phosphodiesterase [Bacillota bacterium]